VSIKDLVQKFTGITQLSRFYPTVIVVLDYPFVCRRSIHCRFFWRLAWII